MKRTTQKILLTMLILGANLLSIAQAGLFDRGNGMIYDDVLKITWLKDANYAKTSGFDKDGRMTWVEAKAWVKGLVYAGYNDWRLPSVGPGNGREAFNYAFSDDGSTDIGYNVFSKTSELAYMFYVNLKNKGWNDLSGESFGCAPPAYCLSNTGMFDNLQRYVYWSGIEYARLVDRAWTFYTFDGLQNYHSKDNEFYAWAVRSGDVGKPKVAEK